MLCPALAPAASATTARAKGAHEGVVPSTEGWLG
jgi:hypothetical protein